MTNTPRYVARIRYFAQSFTAPRQTVTLRIVHFATRFTRSR